MLFQIDEVNDQSAGRAFLYYFIDFNLEVIQSTVTCNSNLLVCFCLFLSCSYYGVHFIGL